MDKTKGDESEIHIVNAFNYEKLGYVPEKLFHFTLSDNLKSISRDCMLKADVFGYVYLTETIDDASKFANVYAQMRNINLQVFSIIEIDTDGLDIDIKDLYISTDHNKEHFLQAEAIAHYEDLEVLDFKEYKFN